LFSVGASHPRVLSVASLDESVSFVAEREPQADHFNEDATASSSLFSVGASHPRVLSVASLDESVSFVAEREPQADHFNEDATASSSLFLPSETGRITETPCIRKSYKPFEMSYKPFGLSETYMFLTPKGC